MTHRKSSFVGENLGAEAKLKCKEVSPGSISLVFQWSDNPLIQYKPRPKQTILNLVNKHGKMLKLTSNYGNTN